MPDEYPEIEGLRITVDKSVTSVTLRRYEDYRNAVDGLIEAVSLRFRLIRPKDISAQDFEAMSPEESLAFMASLEDLSHHEMMNRFDAVLVPAVLWVNEEFVYRYDRDQFNSIATDIAGTGGRYDLLLTGIKGPVLITGPTDSGGYSTSIPKEVKQIAERIQREARLGEN